MNINALALTNSKIKNAAFDFLALAVITLTPALSHMFALPIYLIEPMRIMLIFSLIHTSRKNAYLLALVLPLFSYFISAHPVLPKMLLIASELVLNVWLFTFLTTKFKNNFISVFLSIALSKVYYYVIKIGLVSFAVVSGNIISTPLYIQLVVSIVLSLYAFFMFIRKEKA